MKLDPDDENCHMDNVVDPTNDVERLAWIEEYLAFRKMAYPELCGGVAGILFRDGKRQEAREFLEVDDIDEPRYWDS